MVKTTIDIDPTVLAELKERGRREGKSVGVLASELLTELLAPRLTVTAKPGAELTWCTSDMGPLVDLGSKDRVRDMLGEA